MPNENTFTVSIWLPGWLGRQPKEGREALQDRHHGHLHDV